MRTTAPQRRPVLTLAVLTALAATAILSGCASIERKIIATFEVPMPAEYEQWVVQSAAQCEFPEITGAVLAAQLATESGFKTDAVSPRGAEGPAQFIPDAWDVWGVDADGDGVADPRSIADAVTAQGRFVCDNYRRAVAGIGNGTLTGDPLDLALAGYNAGWGTIERFGGMPSGGEYTSETQVYVERIRLREMHYPQLR